MVDTLPAIIPTNIEKRKVEKLGTGVEAIGNNGPVPMITSRKRVAVAEATPTGIKLLGFHSNKSSSTDKRTAATGELKTAAIPPAAPATRSVFLSIEVSFMNWAKTDPKAPPVIMIGPSAPKGPPDPIDIAVETGFRTATLGSILLFVMRIDSSASGMPCPLILSDPYLAIIPMMM